MNMLRKQSSPTIRELALELEPFARIAALNEPIGHVSPDDRPLVEVLPSGWPTMKGSGCLPESPCGRHSTRSQLEVVHEPARSNRKRKTWSIYYRDPDKV